MSGPNSCHFDRSSKFAGLPLPFLASNRFGTKMPLFFPFPNDLPVIDHKSP